MIISAIREIVHPKVTQIAKCGSLASTVIDSAKTMTRFFGRPIASWFVLIDDRRGGSRAGSLGGAQQLTGGGGVVAEIAFVSRSRPDSVGGGGGVVAEISVVSGSRPDSGRNVPRSPEAGPRSDRLQNTDIVC